MNLPYIGISLVIDNKEEVLEILQGVTRYINTIYVNWKLFKNEGIDILIFLEKRYPKKKVIFDYSNEMILTNDFIKIVKKTKINEFVLSNKMSNEELQKTIDFIVKNKKKIIIKGNKFDVDFLNKNNIKKIFFFKEEIEGQIIIWKKSELEIIKNLIKDNFYLIVGDVVEETIQQFEDILLQEITIGRTVCYSFVPIKTCKNIYLLIKDIFTE